MTANQEHLEIIRTIMALARNLEMEVIAEGVETQEQAAVLRAMDCEYGQGYYFSRALNAKRAATLLSSDPVREVPPPLAAALSGYEHALIA